MQPSSKSSKKASQMSKAELDAVVEQKRREARERDAKKQSNATKTDKKQVVSLPVWPEAVRAVPNCFLRSALFGVVRKGPRTYLQRQEIHAQEGIRIVYTGIRLDQGDLDVWETILHMARLQALGDKCHVTAYQLLKLLGKTDTGANRNTLDMRLSRMKATAIDVTTGKDGYEGSLIDEVFRDRQTREYVIRINHRLSGLFAADQFTQIDWAVRQTLDGKQLAQWLHGFYASHAKPFPIKIETLHRLCGSETGEMWKFAQTLRKALDDVAEVSAAHGQRFNYEICGDLVHVDKEAKRTQMRHLNKAKKSK